MRGTAIVVEETPDDETLAEMGIDNPWDLTGLYRGVPLTQKSVLDVPQAPDTILLFREPILLEWIETGEELFRLVRNVLIHEIGHHFGLSDAISTGWRARTIAALGQRSDGGGRAPRAAHRPCRRDA